MSAFHKRTPAEYVALRTKILRIWNSEPDIGVNTLSERFQMGHGNLHAILVDAFEKGETQRSTARGLSTRASRTGRLP